MSIETSFTGNLTRDPERKTSQSGREYLRLNVAVQDKTAVAYVNVMAFENVGELASRLAKGSTVSVEGTLKAKIWEGHADGKPRLDLTVLSFNVQLGERKKRERSLADSALAPGANGSRGEIPASSRSMATFASDKVPNDPLPF